jgi:hypothetical protein
MSAPSSPLALGVLRWVPESHPLHARLTGGPAASPRTIGSVAAQRAVLTPVLALAFGGAVVFAYIAGTTFVFQDIYRHGSHGHMPHSGHPCRRRDQADKEEVVPAGAAVFTRLGSSCSAIRRRLPRAVFGVHEMWIWLNLCG